MGDFNINLLNTDLQIPTAELIYFPLSYSFISLINNPTLVNDNPATLIDNILICESTTLKTISMVLQ